MQAGTGNRATPLVCTIEVLNCIRHSAVPDLHSGCLASFNPFCASVALVAMGLDWHVEEAHG